MAGEKRSQDQEETLIASTVLVDIEGTTTSISFVKVNAQRRRSRARERRARTNASRELGRVVTYYAASRRSVLLGGSLAARFSRWREILANGISPPVEATRTPPGKSSGHPRTRLRLFAPVSRRAYMRSNSTAGYCPRIGAVCRRLESSFRAIASRRHRHTAIAAAVVAAAAAAAATVFANRSSRKAFEHRFEFSAEQQTRALQPLTASAAEGP